MGRPSVLVLAWDLPFPADAGARIRSFHLLRAVSEVAAVRLVCFQPDGGPVRSQHALTDLGVAVTVVPAPAFRPHWRHHLSPAPLITRQYRSNEMRESVRNLARLEPPDLTIVDGLFMAPYVKGLEKGPLLYQAHNVEYEIYRQTIALQPLSTRRRLASRFDCWKLVRFERHWARRFPFLAAVSEHDRTQLQQWAPTASVFVVPNGVDCDGSRPPRDVTPESWSIAFAGTLSYPPNRDAVLFFGREVFPRIQREIPSAKFYVIGREDPEVSRNLTHRPGIVLTGYVEDVRHYLARVRAVVVPLRAGSGTRLKILEAMSMALPVISTSIGAGGLELRAGEEIVIADHAEAFSAAVVALLGDPVRAEALGIAGRRAVAARYDWAMIRHDYQRAIMDIVRSRAVAGTRG